MTLPEILAFSRAQGRKPWAWGIVLALGLTNFLSDVLASPAGRSRPAWYYGAYLLVTLLGNGSGIRLGPWPWQWTGRSGNYPSFPRGLLQALLFGSACLVPVLLLRIGVHAMLLPGSWAYGRFLLRFYGITFVTMSCLLGFGIVAFQKEDAAREEAERQAQAARWVLLRGQMGPGFFLDAMDHLVDLIRRDPGVAEHASMRLSDLFRRVMNHARSHLVPLGVERSLVERYLDLQGVFLGDKLRVSWDWSPGLDDVLVPPFLLQPLVENAIRHALALPPVGGDLRITGRLDAERVAIRVENSAGPPAPPHGPGLSLDDLEARMRLAFGDEGTFRLSHDEARTCAELRFPVLQEAL